MVVDASAMVAVFKAESKGPAIRTVLEEATELVMASVTLTEVALAGLKIGVSALASAARVRAFGIAIIPVTEAQAINAAEARHRFPIRFGDAFVYALAKEREMPILTLDAEFAKTDAALVPLDPRSSARATRPAERRSW